MAYTPAGNLTTTSTISHLATVWYVREARDVLRTKTLFTKALDPQAPTLPRGQGKTAQWHRYGVFGANTTAKTEGQVGTSLQLTTNTVSATVAQYTDFLSLSDFLEDTAIDNIRSNAVKELSYRAALTVDNLIRTEADAVATDIPLAGQYFQRADLATARNLLQGVNILPLLSGGYFFALAHPYVTYDYLNDPQAGGFQDLVKHDASSQGRSRLNSLEDRGFIARDSSVELWESTNVTKPSASPGKWRVYVFGAGALYGIDLAGRGPSRVMDPQTEMFNIAVIPGGPSQADPEGVISSYVSYNFKFVVKTGDTVTSRTRKLDAESSIVA